MPGVAGALRGPDSAGDGGAGVVGWRGRNREPHGRHRGYFRVVAVSSVGVATLSNTMQVLAPNAKVGDYLYPLVNHWGRQWSPNCPLGAGTVLIDRTRLFQAAFFGILNVKPLVTS